MSLWVRKRLRPSVTGVQSLSCANGVLGLFGNKGAVLLRARVQDTGLLLVCSHLSSGDKPGDDAKRNTDFWDVLRKVERV